MIFLPVVGSRYSEDIKSDEIVTIFPRCSVAHTGLSTNTDLRFIDNPYYFFSAKSPTGEALSSAQ